MARRPISVGQRVYTVFWNEITERDLGRGPNNPITHRGTVISGGSGSFTVRFEAAESDDNNNLVNSWRTTGHVDVSCDAHTLYREGEGVDSVVRRQTWWSKEYRERPDGPLDLWWRRWHYRDYQRGLRGRWVPEGLSMHAYERFGRRFNARYKGVDDAQKALRERATQYGKEKRRALYLAEALRTPMVFPPAHPGCDEPIYPILNEERTWFGDGWTCRTHGNVTESVKRTYYPEPRTPRKTTKARR